MTANTERFAGRVGEYVRCRLRYPQEVLTLLRKRCGLLTHHGIADIGAGTGMLAELFLEHGNSVVAIEPNARNACCLRADEEALLFADGT